MYASFAVWCSSATSITLPLSKAAVESFLLLAAEYGNVQPPGEFKQYWNVITAKSGDKLGSRHGMKRLNDIRVGLKHHGTHPDATAIDQAISDSTTILASSTVVVFGIDYESASMAHAIPQEVVRDLVLEAESASDTKAAMVTLVRAFNTLMNSLNQPDYSTVAGRDSLSDLGAGLSFPLHERDIVQVLRPPDGDRRRVTSSHSRLARQIVEVTNTVNKLQAATQILTLGIDVSAYERFSNLTPASIPFIDGHTDYIAPVTYSPSFSDVEFCISWVCEPAFLRPICPHCACTFLDHDGVKGRVRLPGGWLRGL